MPDDTGMEWAGWHRSGSESLLHACRDTDPGCVVTFATEAIEAARLALGTSLNARQKAMSESLLDAGHAVRRLGKQKDMR